MDSFADAIVSFQLVLRGTDKDVGLVEVGRDVSGTVELVLRRGITIRSIYLVAIDENGGDSERCSLIQEKYSRIQLFGKFERFVGEGKINFPFTFELGDKRSKALMNGTCGYLPKRNKAYSLAAALKVGANPALFAETVYKQEPLMSLSTQLVSYTEHYSFVKKRRNMCGSLLFKCLVSCTDMGIITFRLNFVNNSTCNFGRIQAKLLCTLEKNWKENERTIDKAPRAVAIKAYNWPVCGPSAAAKKLLTWTVDNLRVPQTLGNTLKIVLCFRTERGNSWTASVPRVAYAC